MEQWPERRREHFSFHKALSRRTWLSRNTIRAALRSTVPPVYQGARAGRSWIVQGEIHRLLKREPDMRGQRVRELIASA